MKKMLLCFLVLTSTAFAERFTLNNQTSYPDKDTKMAIQWANTAKEVSEQNETFTSSLNLDSLKTVTRSGKTEFDSPAKAQYFRVVVWKQGEKEPEFLTNWIDIEAKKTYTLQDDQLVPAVLMAGMGC